MPARQRDCLQALALFLADVAALSNENKMKPDNLAKVIVPNVCKYDTQMSADVASHGDVHARVAALFARMIAQPMAAFNVPRSVAPHRATYNVYVRSAVAATERSGSLWC